MTQMIPETIPGLDAANAYPENFEGYSKKGELPLTEVIAELADKDASVITETLMEYIDKGKLTYEAANGVIDQIAILRAKQNLDVQ